MNRILKGIFIYVADKLGLELAKKTEQSNDFYDIDGISLTAALAERISTITLTGSKLNVEGTNQRAEYIETVAKQIYQSYLKNTCTFALGTGSALLKPNTDGNKFGFDIIPESDYMITGYTGEYIYSIVVKAGEYDEGNHTYTLIESQSIQEYEGVRCCEVIYTAFLDENEIELEKTKWSDRENYIIPNVDRILVGRIKCPVTNRKDVNSPNGVPITFGLGEVVENSKDSYRMYNKEFKDKETMIFADKTLLKRDDNGKVYVPRGKEGLFMKINSRNVDNTLIDTYSPEIRDTSLDNSIERNFRVLELLAGLGEGVLSKSTLTYTNMDEVRAMKQATFSFISSLRESIDSCIEDVLYAVNVICNYNEITPQGDYEAYMDWSDEYMTSLSERFNQMLQADNAGWIEPAEGRSIVMNEDIDEAREMISKIKSSSLEDFDTKKGEGEEE